MSAVRACVLAALRPRGQEHALLARPAGVRLHSRGLHARGGRVPGRSQPPRPHHPVPASRRRVLVPVRPTQKPYRDIVEWVDRKITEFPADAEEPDYDWMDAETWAKIRKPRPHSSAFWKVKLDCGHHQQVCTDVDWKPEMSPSCCPRSASRRSAVISRRVGRPRGTLAGHTRAPSATTSGR